MSKVVVITGGPASGKTSLIERISIEYDCIIIPEIFSKSLPWIKKISEFERQVYIYNQHIFLLEEAKNKGAMFIVCDRGTLDALAYVDLFMFYRIIGNCSLKNELNRYDCVLNMESIAFLQKIDYNKMINSRRMENRMDARRISRTLKEVWSQHPNYYSLNSEILFENKMEKAMEIIKEYAEL